MAFFKTQTIGRIYVVKLVLPDDTVVHKVGMCNSPRSTDRMLEVLRSWFNAYRFVPYAELRLDLSCHEPRKIEQYIHRVLAPVAFEPSMKVDGGTEMFTDINEKKLIWFIKAAVNSMYVDFPEVDDDQVVSICKLLTV